MLDFDSEVFIWVGMDVKPKSKIAQAYEMALQAMEAVHSRGKYRQRQATVSLVYYGYEPYVFREAFKKGWRIFDKPDAINEYDDTSSGGSNSDIKTDSDEEKKKEEPVDAAKFVKLNKQSLAKAATNLIADLFWIN